MICKVTVQPDKTRMTINTVQRKGQAIPAKTKPSPATPVGPAYKCQQRHREYSKKIPCGPDPLLVQRSFPGEGP